MPNQRWVFGNLLVFFSCVALSQQGLLHLKRSASINDEITNENTNVFEGAVNIKDEFAIHKENQNILDPTVHKFDPKWLKNINYTFWVASMSKVSRNGNAQQMAETIKRMFDVPRVIEEIKTSTTTKVTCFGCQFLVNLARHMFSINKTNEEVLFYGSTICTGLNISTSNVCGGIMKLIGIEVIEVVRESTAKSPAQICSFYFQDTCSDGYDPNHDWSIHFPSRPKLEEHMTTPPPDNLPKLKVLQITDTHYDPRYREGSNAECGEPMCCRISNGMATSNETAAGKWGDYRKCDTPRILFENAFKHIADTHKDIDYIIWTGDLPPHDIWNQTREDNLANLRLSAQLMDKYFKGIPIYPSVGNHESCPIDSYIPESGPSNKNMSWLYNELNKEWSRWLPPSTSATIRHGAYYSLLIRPGFRILSVNGNFCGRNNFWLLKNSTDPAGELAWLIRELDAAEAKGEKVHILGHVPPGGNDCIKVWSKNYYDIINRYEAIIMAQFYGHSHFDEFEVFYDNKNFKRPINVGYISPSITPYSDVNPAYRIYYVDGDHPKSTRAILDHETWKMNLDEANKNDKPVWYKSYNAKEAYNMTSLLPKDWDLLIDKMKTDKNLFETYHSHYYRDSPVRPDCDDTCQKDLLCNAQSARSHDKSNLCKDII